MSAEKYKPLLFAHIGDLHITEAKQQNYKDFLSIVSQLAVEFEKQLDFVLLPGDNADNGLLKQYRLIKPALKMLEIPVFLLTGDHDMEQGDLTNFYYGLQANRLPFKETIKGVNCLFLDVCGPGSGGPDFRLGKDQLERFGELLTDCKGNGGTNILFMHTYPDDLNDKDEQRALLQMIAEYDIALVDMGHTHYNEISGNGKTIYTATRSTGQIAEGPVGYSITSIDNGVVSWRFRNLDDPFPFVLITSPADHRLFRMVNQTAAKEVEIRATVLGSACVKQVTCILDDESFFTMNFDEIRNDWVASIPFIQKPTMKISVEAITIDGRPGRHSIEIATPIFNYTSKLRDGSDGLSIGAWPENGILGTQLGPNRNAKPAKKKGA